MQPQELQSISGLTMRADSPSFISSLPQVTLLIIAAHNYFKKSATLIIRNDEPEPLFGHFIHRIRRFLCGAIIKKGSPIRNITQAVLNSTVLSGAMARETMTISSIASPDSQVVTIGSDSIEPTFPYGFGNQYPLAPPSLIYLNLPHNPFNELPNMAVIRIVYFIFICSFFHFSYFNLLS